MPAIRLTSFRGMAPGLGAKLLESNQATEARNCRLDMGELIPWAAPSVAHDPAKWSDAPSTATIFKYSPDGAGPYWLHWPNAVSVTRGPIADDPEQRLYYTTDDDDTIPPRMTKSDLVDGSTNEWPVNYRPLGVPAPATKPSVNVVTPTFDIVGLSTSDDFFEISGDQTDSIPTGGTISVSGSTGNNGTYNVTDVVYDSGADKTRVHVSENVEDDTADGTIEPECDPALVGSTSYVYTYVTDLGEEGPPSEPSEVVDRCDFRTVELSDLDTAPASGRFTNAVIANQRIYRAASGASGTEFLFVAEQSPSTSYTDKVSNSGLVEPIPTANYAPPHEKLKGFVVLSNGIAAGFVGSDLYLSEPYRPHAWPEAYRQAIGWPIVGLGAFGTSIVVLTEGHPYIVQGTTPASMTAQEIEQPQACVSARGIVSSGLGVLYPSPDGLVRVSGQGAQVITENIIDRATWQAINPDNLLATWHEGLYFGFTANGSETGFTIDPRSGEFVWLDFESVAAYTDLTDDTLYLVDANGGADDGSIVAWNRGSANMTATWRSKPFIATPTNFGAGRLLAESYGTLPTQRLYGDDSEVYAASSLSRRPFRLPAGDVHRKWQIEVETDVTVSETVIASTMGELDG